MPGFKIQEFFEDFRGSQRGARDEGRHALGIKNEWISSSSVGIGAAGRPSESIFDGRGEIKSLYVDPDFKRQGIGRQLLAQLAIHLKEMHYLGCVIRGSWTRVSREGGQRFRAKLDVRSAATRGFRYLL
ncbi:GNAT family N-acetyltransferase [Paraburkholderia sp. 22099]|uniref:GNAT family N-acetyltransferase n=1 Tax=Paraburkholderia sp. 22099 TaxID=3453875 RepID=UPI003F82BFE9